MSSRAKFKLRQLQSVFGLLAKAGDFFSGPGPLARRYSSGNQDLPSEGSLQHEPDPQDPQV